MRARHGIAAIAGVAGLALNPQPASAECRTTIVIATGLAPVYRFTSVERGAWFDLTADGVKERVAWTLPKSEVAFLVLDRNGNGTIDDGSELFGDCTLPEAGNGFHALRLMAQESAAAAGVEFPAVVNSDVPLFSELRLWHDRNQDGISQPEELSRPDVLFSDLGLGYSAHARRDQHGNEFRYRGHVTLRTGPGPNWPTSGHESAARARVIYEVRLAAQ